MVETFFIFNLKQKLKQSGFKISDVKKDHMLNEIRGLFFPDGKILINLSAIQFKDTDERQLIGYLTETITHEYIHSECSRLLGSTKRNDEQEETICRIMAGQLLLKEETLFPD